MMLFPYLSLCIASEVLMYHTQEKSNKMSEYISCYISIKFTASNSSSWDGKDRLITVKDMDVDD